MKRFIFSMLLCSLPLGFVTAANVDYYLKIEGVDGESSASSETRSQPELQRTNNERLRESSTSSARSVEVVIDDGNQETREGRTEYNRKDEEGEALQSAGIEPDEINFNSGAVPEERKGKVEYNWKVEEGEKLESAGIEPDEIDFKSESETTTNFGVLLGGTDDEAAETRFRGGVKVAVGDVKGFTEAERASYLAAAKAHEQVTSSNGLENFARGILVDSELVEEISFNFEKIEMKYRTRGRLLGFIPMTFDEQVVVETAGDRAGTVEVKMPWFSFLVLKAVKAKDLETAIQSDIATNIGTNQNWDFGSRALALSLATEVLKSKHDTVKNSISNTR